MTIALRLKWKRDPDFYAKRIKRTPSILKLASSYIAQSHFITINVRCDKSTYEKQTVQKIHLRNTYIPPGKPLVDPVDIALVKTCGVLPRN